MFGAVKQKNVKLVDLDASKTTRELQQKNDASISKFGVFTAEITFQNLDYPPAQTPPLSQRSSYVHCRTTPLFSTEIHSLILAVRTISSAFASCRAMAPTTVDKASFGRSLNMKICSRIAVIALTFPRTRNLQSSVRMARFRGIRGEIIQ